jgi:hypothetical protein
MPPLTVTSSAKNFSHPWNTPPLTVLKQLTAKKQIDNFDKLD